MVNKDSLKEFTKNYFSDEEIQNRIIKRINCIDETPEKLEQVDKYIDSIIYGLECILLDRERLELNNLQWNTFINNSLENISLLLRSV
jgi:hypothetical protein